MGFDREAGSRLGRWFAVFVILFPVVSGCASIFGWDIHAPGILSEGFSEQVELARERVALYISPETFLFQSKDRGGVTADPQAYHVGESFVPMLIEGFQSAFSEFIFLEEEPTRDILIRYGIPYVAVVRIKEFKNKVGWRGQAVQLMTEAVVFNSEFEEVKRFESRGTSDAERVFAKKGGPQVNLNAALENNIVSTVQYLQDFLNQDQK